jgi:hypothetical protein
VTVDTTRPEARLLFVECNGAETNAEMVVAWEAADRKLAARPISLYWSSGAGGPWYPIATGLDNTGTFRWKLGDRVPRELKVRLKVRDEAGNESIVESADSVIADRMHPRSQIRGAKPMTARGVNPGTRALR